jgi:hypothetical protein
MSFYAGFGKNEKKCGKVLTAMLQGLKIFRAEQSRAEQADSALFGVLLIRRHPVWDAVGILYSLPDVFCYAGKLCVRRLVRWLEQWRIRMEVMEILYDRGG